MTAKTLPKWQSGVIFGSGAFAYLYLTIDVHKVQIEMK